jgi:hypothetical protein
MADEPDEAAGSRPLGWKALVLILAFHFGALAIATHPAVWNFRWGMAATEDAWVHVWTLRWYKSCLLEHRSILFCPEIQYPAGAPLGSLSPMQFQALLYLPLSFLISSDTICYNILWITGLLLTGLGTSQRPSRPDLFRLVSHLSGSVDAVCGPAGSAQACSGRAHVRPALHVPRVLHGVRGLPGGALRRMECLARRAAGTDALAPQTAPLVRGHGWADASLLARPLRRPPLDDDASRGPPAAARRV